MPWLLWVQQHLKGILITEKLDSLLCVCFHLVWKIMWMISMTSFSLQGCMEELHAQRQNIADVTLRILKCDFKKIYQGPFFSPPWAHISEIILETKEGNGLMTNSCFTHNLSGMLRMHPGRWGCILRLALWHGFCDAVWGLSSGWRPCRT